jgi:hypothetical protein
LTLAFSNRSLAFWTSDALMNKSARFVLSFHVSTSIMRREKILKFNIKWFFFKFFYCKYINRVIGDLGLLIEACLRFSPDATKICSKAYATPNRLCLFRFLTRKSGSLKQCRALLLPHLIYCDVVFSCLSSDDGQRLQVAFNSCTRYVFNLCVFVLLLLHLEHAFFASP